MRAHDIRMVTVGLVALLGVTCRAMAAAPLSPLATDWEHYFSIDWQAIEKNGRPVLRGKVLNTTTCGAKRIQLLIDGLGSSGQVIDQRVVWLGIDLTPGSHAYFEAPAAQGAAAHRVSVFAFDTKMRC